MYRLPRGETVRRGKREYPTFDMTPTFSGRISIFSLALFVLKSHMGIARQWSRERFAILSLKVMLHETNCHDDI